MQSQWRDFCDLRRFDSDEREGPPGAGTQSPGRTVFMRFAGGADPRLHYPFLAHAAFFELPAIGEPEVQMPFPDISFPEQLRRISKIF